MTKRPARRLIIPAIPVLALLVLVACGKKEPAAPATAGGTTAAPAAPASVPGGGDPTRDYKLAYLDDAKMAQFINSLQEPVNPFEMVLKGGGMKFSSIQKEAEKLNAYAQRFGFKGYEDYMAVWGRITVAEMTVAAQGMKKGAIDMIARMKQNAEEQLKRSDLSPEERQSYEQQAADNAKSLEEMQKPDESSMNAQDLALYMKYKEQIEAAVKKFKK